jgi:hypothetical protein
VIEARALVAAAVRKISWYLVALFMCGLTTIASTVGFRANAVCNHVPGVPPRKS